MDRAWAVTQAITDLTFEDTLLTAGQSEVTFSFTVQRQVELYYQIVYHRDGGWQFDQAQHYLDGEQFKQVGANAMVFQFDRLDSLEAFIRRLENTPEYGAGSLQYFANVDDTVNMLSEFYGVAESFRSVSAIFGLLAAAFAVTLAVLDAFYRRRELAILQSIGESGGRLTLQFSLETLLLLILGWAAAIPAALRAVRAAIPGLLRQTAPTENPFATLSENIEMVTLDADRVCERLSYSRQDLIFFALFTLVTVLFCAAAVHICTRRFHVRTLLNH
jgi:hypothetical protein